MDLKISEMMQMQRALYERNKAAWHPMEPEYGKDSLLYMVEEIGEVIAVIKKKGSGAIMDSAQVRGAFLEEMADVLMYYNDILLRYHVSPEEISEAFAGKHAYDMSRNYSKEYEEQYHG